MTGDCSLFKSVQTGSEANLFVSVIAAHVHGGKGTGCVKLIFHLHQLSTLRMSGATYPPLIRLHSL